MVERRSEKGRATAETLSEVAEVGRIWLRRYQLIDHGSEIVERCDRGDGRCAAGSSRSSGGGEQKSGLDDLEGYTAVLESRGEATVGTPGEAAQTLRRRAFPQHATPAARAPARRKTPCAPKNAATAASPAADTLRPSSRSSGASRAPVQALPDRHAAYEHSGRCAIRPRTGTPLPCLGSQVLVESQQQGEKTGSAKHGLVQRNVSFRRRKRKQTSPPVRRQPLEGFLDGGPPAAARPAGG